MYDLQSDEYFLHINFDLMDQVLASLVWFLHVNNVGLFKMNHMRNDTVPEVHFWDQTFLLLT